MPVWLTRAGKHGEDEETALEKGIAIIGWQEIPDCSSIPTYEEMKQKHSEIYPDLSPRGIINNAAQLWSFTKRIKKGDIAVLPSKVRSTVAIGEVAGPYKYLEGRHVRSVKWIRTDVPRTDFGQDLLYSLGAFMTVCQVRRNDAEERLRAMLSGQPDPGLKGQKSKGKATTTEEEPPDDEMLVNLEEQALDQIRLMIQSKFKGHNLTRLVEAILQIQGYQTFRSPEGPDGGVDILAGYGAMGFDVPRLCVQVKSGGVQNDSAVRELEGVMSRMGAEQGLFVSWDGFNKTAMQNTRELFFKVRLWDDRKLMTELLANYDKMPDEIQAELPLKRIWIVVPEEE
jgi:restriction system protein